MSYDDWYKQYVATDPEAVLAEKAYKNKWADEKQFANYKAVLGKDAPKDISAFQRMKYTDNKWKFVRVDYARRNKLNNNSSDILLPGINNLVIEDAKFTKYLFGGVHDEGLIKGKLISARLGYNLDNYVKFIEDIRYRAAKYPVIKNKTTAYGDLYEQSIIIYGLKNNPTNMIISWEHNGNSTRLVTAYIKELK